MMRDHSSVMTTTQPSTLESAARVVVESESEPVHWALTLTLTLTLTPTPNPHPHRHPQKIVSANPPPSTRVRQPLFASYPHPRSSAELAVGRSAEVAVGHRQVGPWQTSPATSSIIDAHLNTRDLT